jgi:glycerol-3-phosphate acyltransferase PlsY
LAAAILVLAYLLGSIPAAYIVGRLAASIDIRTVGTRNVGALNTYHQIGPRAATVVLVLDTLKGALAIVTVLSVWDSPWGCLYAALGVVAGHNWSLFLRFRGGKGLAAALGVSLAVQPWLTLIALAPTIAATAATRNLVVGATVGLALLNLLIITTGQGQIQIIICLSLTLIVAATYIGRSWKESATALRAGRWRDLFFFE